MSDNLNKMTLSAKLIQLNHEGVDLLKEEEQKFRQFIDNLAENQKKSSKPKQSTFSPVYCHHCKNHEYSKNNSTNFSKAMNIKRTIDKAFEGVKEVYFSGGGGAGCAFPSAVNYATHYGLDLSQVEVSAGGSVGAIIALGVALDVDAKDLQPLLADMPTANFQDWSIWNIITKFRSTWGLCRGQFMPNYFKQMIKERTGLIDPTFKELYDAGFRKELRIMSTNVSKGEIEVFSYKTTPDIKVAKTVADSCAIPVFFPVKRIMNEDGEFDIHTDGAVINNYPWGMGAKSVVPNEQRLGFALVNSFSKTEYTRITTLTEYIYNLFMLVLFQRPLSLTEEQRQRTVEIRLTHNPLDFTPSEAQQKYLEDQSHIAVKTLAEQICPNEIAPPLSPKKKLR